MSAPAKPAGALDPATLEALFRHQETTPGPFQGMSGVFMYELYRAEGLHDAARSLVALVTHGTPGGAR